MMRQLFAQKSNSLGCKISRFYPPTRKKNPKLSQSTLYPARTTTSSCNEMPYQAFDLISISFQELAVYTSACTNLSASVVCWSDHSKQDAVLIRKASGVSVAAGFAPAGLFLWLCFAWQNVADSLELLGRSLI